MACAPRGSCVTPSTLTHRALARVTSRTVDWLARRTFTRALPALPALSARVRTKRRPDSPRWRGATPDWRIAAHTARHPRASIGALALGGATTLQSGCAAAAGTLVMALASTHLLWSRRAHVERPRDSCGCESRMQSHERMLWNSRGRGDGARVRDAVTHLGSGREDVGRRETHRGVEPRCPAEAVGR
jgi:hypothetical protein